MWTVETLNATVDDEVEALSVDMRARLVRIGTIIEAVGFQGLPADTIKRLEERLLELRFRGRDGIARAVYVTALKQRVAIVRFSSRRPRRHPNMNWNWLDNGQRRSSDQAQDIA
jgi:phage-related protein